MQTGNLWADYSDTASVGTLQFTNGSTGTFNGGTLKLSVWEGGNPPANGTPSQFSFSGNVNTGNGAVGVRATPVALVGQVGGNQLGTFLSANSISGTGFATTSISIPDGSGHSWTISKVLDLGTISTGNW